MNRNKVDVLRLGRIPFVDIGKLKFSLDTWYLFCMTVLLATTVLELIYRNVYKEFIGVKHYKNII